MGLSKLKQIKTISNYEPELIHKIDKKEISVNQAYNIVKEKHFKTKSKPQNGHFSKRFRSLLNEYKPSKEEIFEVLKTTHPYSLNGFGTSVEINPKLKKKERN